MNPSDITPIHVQIQMMNYMIAGLCFLVTVFAGILWAALKSEREDIKTAIKALENTMIRLDQQYEQQKQIIRIIAKQTKVEIGE